MNKKELVINISSNIIAFLVTFGINFVLSPIIIDSLGKEAYGFYSLGNQFISYAAIISTALNSMAGRFISIRIHENNVEGASRYYSSVFFSNIILSLIFLIPSILIISFLEVLLSIPNNIVIDVKILWFLLFANFIMTLLTNVFNVGTYATNKLYLSSIANIAANVVKAITLMIAFLAVIPKLWYMGLGMMLYTAVIAISNFVFTRKLLPNMKLKASNFDKNAVKDLLLSGMWNSINQLASILNTGITLLITNVLVGASEMGDVSITKTFITAFFQLIAIFASVFSPQLLKIYATKCREEFNINIQFSMRIVGFIVGIILGTFTAFGKEFYNLWVPGQNSKLLLVLTVFELLPFYMCGSINILNEIMLIKNKMKKLAISFLITGILNVVLTIVVVKIAKVYNWTLFSLSNDELCVLLIVGIAGIIMLLRNMTYVVLYSSKQIGVKASFIYKEYLRGFIFMLVLLLIGYGLSIILPAITWGLLIVDVLIMMIISLPLGLFIMLSHSDREKIFSKIRNIIRSNK